MNWSTLLSKYPRSILEDGVALAVLATIESLGLATEPEIVIKTGFDKTKVSATLFQLHLNGLIQYGEEHIRLTNRGQFLVDRFDLTDVILDDIVAGLERTTSRRQSLRRVLRVYRQDSPALFQNSLSTLHAWSRLLQYVSSCTDTIAESEVRGSQRSFLLRDLRIWCAHAAPASRIAEELESPFRALLFDHIVDAEQCRLENDDCHNSSVDYLILLDDSVTSGLTMEKIRSRCHLSSLHRTFHLSQCKSEPFRWYDIWRETERSLSPDTRRGTWSAALRVLTHELSHALLSADDANLKIGPALRHFKLKWDASEFHPLQSGDFLAHVMNATDIGTLARSTNLDRPSLLQLLETLGRKCTDLVETANNATDRDEE